MNNKKLRILIEGAIMIALATVLSMVKLYNLPQGGSITIEMLPLVVMGLRNGTKWGVFTGFVHGLLQMILGFDNVLYCSTVLSMAGCILLDYLLAFACLGLAGWFTEKMENRRTGAIVGSVVCGCLRFVCSFLSGVLIWGAYAPEGMSAVWYSLTYNGSYMIPNIIILAVIVGGLFTVAPKMLDRQN